MYTHWSNKERNSSIYKIKRRDSSGDAAVSAANHLPPSWRKGRQPTNERAGFPLAAPTSTVICSAISGWIFNLEDGGAKWKLSCDMTGLHQDFAGWLGYRPSTAKPGIVIIFLNPTFCFYYRQPIQNSWKNLLHALTSFGNEVLFSRNK